MSNPPVREPSVAGSFYPANAEKLKSDIMDYLSKVTPASPDSQAVISPHAGYTYSGQTAAFAFSSLGPADTYIVIGPNHYGLGSPVSLSREDWKTPLGTVKIDTETADKISAQFPGAQTDEMAHIREHSIEVQIPFLQHTQKDFKIVPICIMDADPQALGEAIGKVISESKKKIKIIASSDFTHFLPEAEAKEIDTAAIKQIENLDAAGFEDNVAGNSLSICGHFPISTTIYAAKSLGIKKAELLKYDTSATTTGDRSNVVGYAAMRFL